MASKASKKAAKAKIDTSLFKRLAPRDFFQWTGMGTTAKPGRRRVFDNLLKEMGRKPDSYDANYEMLRRELKGPEKGTMPKLRATKTIDEATKSFMVTFERPGIPHFEGRVKWSKMALAAYEAEEKKIAKEPPVVALAMREAPARRRKRAAPPRRRKKNSTRRK